MLRTLLSPRLIVSHLLVLTVVAGCVTAALWQWDRLGQAREANALATQRMETEPVDLRELLDTDDLEDLEHRRIHATGTFRPDEEVVQRNRQEPTGNQGQHVLTPLELDDGTPVLVRRGWVPRGMDEPPITQAPPPTGEVTVTGLLELPVSQPSVGARDAEEGRLARVFHTDTGRLDRQIEGELFPLVLRLEDPAPPDGELPMPAGAPEMDQGSHLSYTVQWFSFAVLAAVTYGIWLARRLRRDDHGAEPVGAERATAAAPTP